METETHLGIKLKAEAERLKLKPAQVAELFKIKPPSVYDWYTTGRIHQRHYLKMVEWSGKPLEWWFDFPESASSARLSKNSGFAQSLADLFDSLPDDQKIRVDAMMECTAVIKKFSEQPPDPQTPAPVGSVKSKKSSAQRPTSAAGD